MKTNVVIKHNEGAEWAAQQVSTMKGRMGGATGKHNEGAEWAAQQVSDRKTEKTITICSGAWQ